MYGMWDKRCNYNNNDDNWNYIENDFEDVLIWWEFKINLCMNQRSIVVEPIFLLPLYLKP